MSDIFDYGEDTLQADVVDTDSGLVTLARLAKTASDVAIRLAKAEDVANDLKMQQVKLLEHEIPELMEQLKMVSFVTESGLKISVKQKTKANITDATRAGAVAWFEDNNLDAMLDNVFTLKFDKGQKNDADKLSKTLDDLGVAYNNKKSVYHSTLAAFVRRRDKAGEEVPDALFNVYRRTVAKIG